MEEIALSVEETNQLRISLGLKPLTESKSYVDREKEAVDNLNLYRQEQSKVEKRKELTQTIQKYASSHLTKKDKRQLSLAT